MSTYELSNFDSQASLNSLVKLLNEDNKATHIKKYKNRILFDTENIVSMQSLISRYKGLVIKEMNNGNKLVYKFPHKNPQKHYFLIKDDTSTSHIGLFIEKLQNDDRLKEIEYNSNNRLLTVTSKEKDLIAILRTYLFSVDPTLTINEFKRKRLPRDYFSQKYMRMYVQLGIIIVAMSIAIITRNDNNMLPYIMWIISTYTIGFSILSEAIASIKQKDFFSKDVLMTIALMFCIASNKFYEGIIAIFVYMLVPKIDNFVYEIITSKIDTLIELPKTGIRVRNGVEEEISLYDFIRGDTMKINPGATILIPGIVVGGESTVSSFMNTSQSEEKEITTLHQVSDGDVNTGEEAIYVLIDRGYEDTIYQTLQQLAVNAPTDESKIQRIVHRISKIIKPIIFLLGLFLGIVLPLINYHDYASYIHVGAIIMIIAYQYSSEQAGIFATLSILAKSFNKGIIVESASAYNRLATSQTIVLDRIDNEPINKHEWLLYKKLSHLGKHFVIFNDGPEDLDHPNYEIYNNLTLEDKITKMESLYSPLAYIGDTNKDLDLIEMSDIGISRGGLSDKKLVENSDIVLIDALYKRIYQMFKFARKLRSKIVLYNIIDVFIKVIFLICVIAFPNTPLYLFILIQMIIDLLIVLSSVF